LNSSKFYFVLKFKKLFEFECMTIKQK